LVRPKRIATRQNGKYIEVRDYEFSWTKRHQRPLAKAIGADQCHTRELPQLRKI
jgi:hypothetical protein